MSSLSRRRFLAQLAASAVAGSAAASSLFAQSPAAAKSLPLRLAADPLRPQFHLLPAKNWMNDPNGPIYYNGRYHMFFQYNPNAAVWGDMHWAHASSPDMIHWHHEPVAVAPTPGGYDRDGVFSGCIVMDRGTPTMIYTGVEPPATSAEATLKDGNHAWKEVQCLAVSHDGLKTWHKLPAPIIESPPAGLGVTGFRDPCVWREGQDWMLALGAGFAGKGGAILLYQSSDLRRWTYLHPLVEGRGTGQPSVNPVDNGEMWECPEFFPLGGRHVLLISAMGKVFWKIGKYADRRFTPEREGVADYGAFYAARTQLDREGNRILWGWIPERRPEEEHRAAGWAGAMSLPRVLSLNSAGDLAMTPASSFQKLRGAYGMIRGPLDTDAKRTILAAMRIHNLSAELQLAAPAGRRFQLELRSENDEPFAAIAYQPADIGHELKINNTVAAHTLPANADLHLQLYLDGSVLELFANGKTAITERVYNAPGSPLRLSLPGDANVSSLDLWQIRPISQDRLTT